MNPDDRLKELQERIRHCSRCEQEFGFPCRPVVWGNAGAPIVQISQAPGRKVWESGIPFSDPSGEKLRHEWYQIQDEDFYNPDLFYITSAGHCYPGKNPKGSGDRKPPACCYELWTSQELACKPETQLLLVIGQEAASRLFGKRKLTDLVFEDLQVNGVKAFVLPHPSPLNRKWLRDHPEFESRRLPEIRQAIHTLLEERKKSAL